MGGDGGDVGCGESVDDYILEASIANTIMTPIKSLLQISKDDIQFETGCNSRSHS